MSDISEKKIEFMSDRRIPHRVEKSKEGIPGIVRVDQNGVRGANVKWLYL